MDQDEIKTHTRQKNNNMCSWYLFSHADLPFHPFLTQMYPNDKNEKLYKLFVLLSSSFQFNDDGGEINISFLFLFHFVMKALDEGSKGREKARENVNMRKIFCDKGRLWGNKEEALIHEWVNEWRREKRGEETKKWKLFILSYCYVYF